MGTARHVNLDDQLAGTKRMFEVRRGARQPVELLDWK
jgi:hypothetical protein